MGGDRARGWPTRSIVTSDNPRSEDPEAIIAEILAGVGPRRPSRVSALDRRAAIEPRRSARRAGRRRRRRRQGPRAGPGVRGRAQGARSTTSRSRARRCGHEGLDPAAGRRRGRGRALASPPPAGDRRPGPRGDRLARRRAPATSSSACPASSVDGGRSPPQALRAGAWGVLVAPEHAEAARCAATACCWRPTTRWPRCGRSRRLAARARRAASSASPAPPARRRRRTSSPRCSRRHRRVHASPRRTSTPRSACR